MIVNQNSKSTILPTSMTNPTTIKKTTHKINLKQQITWIRNESFSKFFLLFINETLCP